MPDDAKDADELVVRNVAAWRRWLTRRGRTSTGEWLVLARKGGGAPTTLTYAEALEEALCFGWIDSRKRSRDATSFRQRFTPRKARSPWSRANVTAVERLIADGRMTDAGMAEVERARADGRWDAAYAGQATIEVPQDLADALAANEAAAAMFAILSGTNRYAVLYRLHASKRPETRARKLAQFVEMLERGETIHPQRAGRDSAS